MATEINHAIRRRDIDILINGGEVTIATYMGHIVLSLDVADRPVMPEGFEFKNIIVTQITNCSHLDEGWCVHPDKGLVNEHCNLNTCPEMSERAKDVREEDEKCKTNKGKIEAKHSDFCGCHVCKERNEREGKFP